MKTALTSTPENFIVQTKFANYIYTLVTLSIIIASATRFRQVRTVLFRLQNFTFFRSTCGFAFRSKNFYRLQLTFSRLEAIFFALRNEFLPRHNGGLGGRRENGFSRGRRSTGATGRRRSGRLLGRAERVRVSLFTRTFGGQLRHVHVDFVFHNVNGLDDAFTHIGRVHGVVRTSFKVRVQSGLPLRGARKNANK